MKTILVLMSLISNLALAFNNPSTHEMSYTLIQLASVDANIASVRLNDSGVMTVIKHDRTFRTLKLSEYNKQDLLSTALTLAEAELQTEQRIYLCEILLPAFAIQNLSVFNSQTRSMKLVLTSSSCALPSYTHPKNAQLTETARELKAKLIVLAQQTSI